MGQCPTPDSCAKVTPGEGDSWLLVAVGRPRNRQRGEALSRWRGDMVLSQFARIRWAKAKYTKYQNIANTARTFQQVEHVWKPILCSLEAGAAPAALGIGDEGGLPGGGVFADCGSSFLCIPSAGLRAAVVRSSPHTSSGADGWSRSDLLALPERGHRVDS